MAIIIGIASNMPQILKGAETQFLSFAGSDRQ
jgi:hypothetical protein